MSSRYSWIRNMFRSWYGRPASGPKRRSFRRIETRPQVEQLEVREVLSTLTTAGSVLTYTAGAGINNNISVAISGGNLVFSDTGETITCTISGATGSGTNSVTVATSNGTSGVTLNLADGTDAIAASGIVLTTEPLIINHSGSGLTISGPLTTTTGSITVTNTGTGDITDNAAITSTSGNVTLASTGNIFDNANISAGSGKVAISADTGGNSSAGFTEAATGATITSTSATAPVTITVNTSGGGTGNASIRAISATAGTLAISAFGGSILYSGTDTLNSSQQGTFDDAATLNTLAPAGTANALTYTFSVTGSGSGSIGTAARPIQTSCASGATASLTGGGGGVYFVDWGNPLSVSGASATGAGNVLVVTANAGGHNLTITGPVTAVTGNIFLAGDDNFVDSAAIGGAGFSGTVYLAGNRDEGNTGTLTMTAGSGSITTSNTSANAVLLEDYCVTGTAAGAITLGNITVGTGGTITATTIPTLGLYAPVATAGSADIIAGSTSVVLSAPGGTVNLTAATGRTSSATAGIGTSASPIVVSAANVVLNDTTSTSAALGSIYVKATGTSNTNFAATVTNTTTAGAISLSDTGGAMTINGPTNTAAGGAISLTDTVGNITVSGPLGSSTSGAIAINAGTHNVIFNTAAQSFASTDPVTITAGNAADFQSSVGLAGAALAGGTNGILIDTASALSWGTTGATITGPTQVSGTLAPAAGTFGTLNTANLTLNSSATTQVNVTNTGAGNFSVINVAGAATLAGNLQVTVSGANLAVGNTFTILTATSISGTFANASSIAFGTYTFSASVVSNTVVLTVTGIYNLGVSSGTVYYLTQGAEPNITVSIAGANYVLNDSTDPIVLNSTAISAGWSNINANTATGPISGISNIFIAMGASSAATIAGIAAGAANVSISGANSVDIEGAITTTGNVTIFGVNTLTDGAATVSTPGTITGLALSLTAASGIGSATLPVLTAGTTVAVSSGTADGDVTQTTGSVGFTGTASGAANLNLSDTATAGTLTISGATSTVAGAINLSSAGAGLVIAAPLTSTSGAITATETGSGDLTDNATITSTSGNVTLSSSNNLFANANITTGAGTIAIHANTLGAGTAGFTQGALAILTTANATSSALVITVGGSGNATVAGAVVGTTAGGTYNVTTNGGNVVGNPLNTIAAHEHTSGLAPNFCITAFSTNLNTNGGSTNAGGAGSIGNSTSVPLIVNDTTSAALGTGTFIAGSGGIYVVAFGNGYPFVSANGDTYYVSTALATGAGNIFIQTTNEGGHDLHVEGNVNTGTGSIELDADDSVYLDSGTVGGTVNGQTFAGTVLIDVNMDLANSQHLNMAVGSAITTTSTAANAVVVNAFVTVNGGINIGNVTVGNGGGITLNAAEDASLPAFTSDLNVDGNANPARDGSIAQIPGTVLNAGANGTITLTAAALSTTGGGNITANGNNAALQVTAGTVNATTSVNAATAGGNIVISDSVPVVYNATSIGVGGATSGFISLATTGGSLTVNAPIYTAGGSVTLTAANGGIIVNAALGNTATGAIALDSTTNGVTINSAQTFYSNDPVTVATAGSPLDINSTAAVTMSGGTLTSVSGVQVDNGGTLAGAGAVSTSSNQLTVDGTLAPSVSTSGLNTDLTLQSDATLPVTLISAAAGQYSRVNVVGPVTLNSPTLVITVSGPVHVGDTFEIISNDATDPVTGAFSNATFTASNVPGYAFTVNYAGGDGNDVVLTVSAVPTTDNFDVTTVGTTATGSFSSNPSANSNLTVGDSNGVYTISDAAQTITLTQNAMNAGWTGSGTNTITGPTSFTSGANTITITNLSFALVFGNDAFASLAAGAASVSTSGSGTLSINGPVTTTGSVTISGYTSVDFEGSVTATGNITVSGVTSITDGAATTSTPGTLSGATISLAASTGIGSATLPIVTGGTTITAAAGAGGDYLSQTFGSPTFTATATGAGNIVLADGDLTGTLTIGGATSTVTGNITITAAGAIADNANISAGTGTITISANTAATGAAGFTQGATAILSTTNNTASAVTITVGGSGNAVLAGASVGDSLTGGTYNVITNGGNIVGNPANTFQTNAHDLSGPTAYAISSYTFNLNTNAGSANAGGAGSIGNSTTVPLLINSLSTNATATSTFIAGSGGIDVVAFGNGSGGAYHVTTALATGAGNIFIQTSNEGGHDLHIGGNINTGTGSIELDADDSLYLDAGTIGGTVNGQTFMGTVQMDVNMDLGNSQVLTMAPGTAITTGNTSSTAVVLNDFPTASGSNVLGNVTVGNGGTISLNAAVLNTTQTLITVDQNTSANTARDGSITQNPGTTLNAGATGTINLTAAALSATAGGNIGTAGAPINTIAGTINATTSVNGGTVGGNIYITNQGSATFTATTTAATTGADSGGIGLAVTNGVLTIGGATNTPGGPIGLTSTGTGAGVVLNATLGLTTSGAIAITGPLSGAGSIQMGVSGLTLAQNTNSSYAGVIKGAAGDNVVYSGPGALTLTGTSTFVGTTTVSAGSLIVNGSLSATTGATVAGAGFLEGSGSVHGAVVDSGTVAPGGGTGGTAQLSLGGLSFAGNGGYVADLNGTTAGTGYDQIVSTGTVNVAGGALSVNLGSGYSPALGTQFTIISDPTGTISGTFASGATVIAFNNPSYVFGVAVSTHTVILTVQQIITAPQIDVQNGNEVLYETQSGINSAVTVSTANNIFTIHDASVTTITLTSAATAAGWTVNGNTATGPTTNITTMLLDLNDGSDAIASLNAGSANVILAGLGTLTVGGTMTTTGNIAIDQFTTITNNAAVNGATGIAINDSSALTMNGTGSYTSSAGSIAVSSDLTSGTGLTVASGLGFSAVASGSVSFNSGGYLMTLGSETIAQGALSILNASTLTLNGALTDSSSAITISSVVDVVPGTGENIVTPNLSVSSTNSIGTANNNLATAAANIVVSTGNGGAYISQNGSANFTASATGNGNVSITDTHVADTVTIAGASSTVGGNVVISAAGPIADNANITTGGGTITINANTANTGTAGFTQGAAVILTTPNTTTSALTINVGGSGSAEVAGAVVGTTAGGTYNVVTNGGNIVGNPANVFGVTQPEHIQALAPTFCITAYTFNLNTNAGSVNAGGSGSIGTSTSIPLLVNVTVGAVGAAGTYISGSGGIYIDAFGNGYPFVSAAGDAFYVKTALAFGAGNIFIQTTNEGGHDLHIEGPVNTGAGSIELDADDSVYIDNPTGVVGGTVVGGTVNGQVFNGTVLIDVNMDLANSQTLTMATGTAITTTNTSTTAVTVDCYVTVNGGMTISNISVGNGGTITLNAAANAALAVNGLLTTDGSSNPARDGSITQLPNTTLNAGATGTIDLLAAAFSTTAGGNIGSSGSGTIQTIAGTIYATTTVNSGTAGGNIYINNQGPATFTAAALAASSGPTSGGFISLSTTSGLLTIGGATSDGGGSPITITSTGASGGITIAAPLGSTSSGGITLNAGANSVLFTTVPQTFTSSDPVTITAGTQAEIGSTASVTLNGGTWTSASGTKVDSGASLSGTGIVASAVNVLGGGTLTPGAPVGVMSVGNVTLNATSNVAVTLDSATAPNFSQLSYTGTANLGGANLQVYVGGNLAVGNSFTIVNATNGTLSGTFGNAATTVAAANNPFYIFSVSYAGNNVTLTVTQVPTTDVLDVVGGSVNFYALFGVPNNITVGLASGNYTITDTAQTITLTQNAVNAGWTGSGTNTVTGPTSYNGGNTIITNLAFNTQDANDTFHAVSAGSASVTITGAGTGTLDFEANVTTTGNIAVTGYTAITDGALGSTGVLTGNVLTLNAPYGIGTSAQPILTAAQSDTATATGPSLGTVFITQTGAGSVTATASSTITIADTSGALTAAATSTTGDVTVTSADSITLGGNVNAGSGHIIISADTDGLAAAGTPSYNQAGYSLITTNTDDTLFGLATNAATITVNANGGSGDAIIGMGQIGNLASTSLASGGIAVNANGGNILWSNSPVYTAFTASQTGLANGGSNSQTLVAHDYFLTTTGAGSIGTNARPVQLDGYAIAKVVNSSDMALAAGSGGIYVTEWGNATNDAVTLDSAIATGAGNIRVVAANAGAHNLYVDGPVTTGSGSIAIYADDDLILTTDSINTALSAQIGGAGFSGTVDLQANRDLGNYQILDMGTGTTIVTSNTSASAVSLQANSAGTGSDTPGDVLIPWGGVVVTNITTGNGGGITIAANNAGGTTGSASPGGAIAMRSGGSLNAGANGTITLIANSNGGEPDDGDIGFSGSPIQVTAATVVATSVNVGAATAPTGNIFLNSASGSVFTASTTGNSAATVNLTGQVNANLTTTSAAYNSVGTAGTAINLSGATLNVTEGTGFSPAPNAMFDILVNTSGQAFAAPFSNYAEGTIFTVGTDHFSITYLGGASGHDVVLTYLAPVIFTQPTNQTVIAGNTATFTAAATGSPSVQWYVNSGSGFTLINGATSTTLSLPNVTLGMTGYLYEATFTNIYGSATTNSASLTVLPATTTTITSNTPNPSIAGTNVAFVVTVSPTVPNGELVQLQDGGVNIPGASGTLTAGSVTINYTGLSVGSHSITAVYAGDANYGGSTSTAVTQNVDVVPVITGQPSNQTVSVGGNASFTATASGTPTPTVLWYVNTGSGFNPLSNAGVYSGVTTGTLTITGATAGMNGYTYEAKFTNPVGIATTNAASLTVNSTPPTVSSVVVNGGASQYTDSNGLQLSLAGQNSVVEQILVTFSQAVTVGAGAFTVTNDASAVTVYGGPSPNTAAVTTSVTPVSGSGNTQFIVTFSGAGTTAIPGGSGNVIKDGLYVLNIVGANVTSNATGLHPANTNKVFWALYGSASSSNVLSPTLGDGNSEIFVDTSDFTLFHNTFGSESDIPAGPPAYNAAFDSNLDGYVDTLDFSKFHSNFGADWGF